MKNCCKLNLETGPSIVILQENKELSKTGISRITAILGVNKQTKKSHPPWGSSKYRFFADSGDKMNTSLELSFIYDKLLPSYASHGVCGF